MTGKRAGREGEGENERERAEGREKERVSLEDKFQAIVTEARSALGLTSQLPKLALDIKSKQQQQHKNTRHNELLSTTVCPHCSLLTSPGICSWLPSLTLPNATSKLLTEFHVQTFPDKVLPSPRC